MGSLAGRSYERREPWPQLAARGLLAGLSLFVAGPLACASALRFVAPPDALRWALGTGLGVAASGCAVAALWARASRRRYGRALLFADGATFERWSEAPAHLTAGQVELEGVTEHGVLLVPRGAGRWARWWSPWLVPTSGPAESEALVAEVTRWQGRAGAGQLRLEPAATQTLALGLTALLPFAAIAAVRVAEAGWSWLGFSLWGLSLVDLIVWALPLGASVQLLPGSVVFGNDRYGLDQVRLELSAGRWLAAIDVGSGRAVGRARLDAEQAARLRSRLGDRLTVASDDPARRRHLARALALLALGGAALAGAIASGLP